MSIEVRPARADDAHAVAQVHVASWRAAYGGLLPGAVLAGLSVDQRAEHWRRQIEEGRCPVWVAVDPDVQGFVCAGDARDADRPDAGEVYALYVAPERWGGAVGHRLLGSATGWLAPRHPRSVLWVLAGNERARRFYGRQGWAPDGAEKHEQREDVVLHEVRLAVQHQHRAAP